MTDKYGTLGDMIGYAAVLNAKKVSNKKRKIRSKKTKSSSRSRTHSRIVISPSDHSPSGSKRSILKTIKEVHR